MRIIPNENMRNKVGIHTQKAVLWPACLRIDTAWYLALSSFWLHSLLKLWSPHNAEPFIALRVQKPTGELLLVFSIMHYLYQGRTQRLPNNPGNCYEKLRVLHNTIEIQIIYWSFLDSTVSHYGIPILRYY